MEVISARAKLRAKDSACVTLGWGAVRLASVFYFSIQKRLRGLDVREGTQSKGLPATVKDLTPLSMVPQLGSLR